MQVRVLGAAEAWRDEQRVELGTRKRRALVAALAMHGGHPVSVDALVDLLWGDTPPDGVTGTLQVYVSGLRRALEPERAPRAPASVLVTVAPGYALHVPDGGLDVTRFDTAVAAAHRRLSGGAVLTGEDYAATHAALDAALDLWRGVPYVELEDHPQAVAERARLEELRSVAIEDRAVAALALGDHATVAGELEALTTQHPLRERLWALRALALTRSGRQADALDVLAQVRAVLHDELGLEPGPELRELQTAVLRQDPALAWTAPAGEPAVAPRPRNDVRASPSTPGPRPVAAPVLPPWPLVGRAEELATLVHAYGEAEQGRLTFVSVTGEPGIGKSRLCAELAHVVTGRGGRLLLGRCSQDDGAPPLWPWQQVLTALGEHLPEPEGDDEGAAFRAAQTIRDRVLAHARDGAVVLVLDDLHWSDSATLRVLRMLVDTVDHAAGARLLVVLTWRSHPEPSGPLADLVESLARRHAERLRLTGLGAEEVKEVVGAVTEAEPTAEQADRLTARTDGNPFFLVEYARLARERGDLVALMDEAQTPRAVSDVLTRRLARLPELSRTLVRWAAVIGREFDLTALAEAATVAEDDVLDALDPVLESGLLREDAIGRYLFGHALVRDTAYAAWTATRRARAHARVATVLADHPGRETEVARHWLAAGPPHAGEAWRAASRAATEVMRTRNAYATAADLLGAGLDAMRDDPSAGLEDRYDLLMQRTDTFRWQGDWISLLATALEAIEVATRLDDVRRLSRAAACMTQGALWQSPGHGVEHPEVVVALRHCLVELPPDERRLRCEVVLALAAELYYTGTPLERETLVEEGLALARSIGDPALLVHACQIGFVATWRPSTARARLALGTEAVELAEQNGDARGLVIAQTLVAIAHNELGNIAEMWTTARRAGEGADRLHLPYPRLVVDALLVSWLVQDRRYDEAAELLTSIQRLGSELRLVQAGLAELGAYVSIQVWRGGSVEVGRLMAEGDSNALPMQAAAVTMLARGGQHEEARELAARSRFDLGPDNWFSMLNWACTAEAALVVGDRDLAREAYARLAPYAGQVASGGSGTALGPVDAFLALAAHVVGDDELAARHADEAARLCATWRIPLVAQWLHDQRERCSF